MAYDALTTSGINSLVSAYITSEQNKLITPLNSQKTKYSNLSNAWNGVTSRLTALKSIIADLNKTGSDSVFIPTSSASSSNTNFVSVSSTNTASVGTFNIKVNQLAKTDAVLSSTLTSASTNSISAGVRSLRIRSGDFETNFNVEFSSSETNLSVMEKIRDAVNSNSKADVLSSKFLKTDSFTMDENNSTFDINLNGNTTSISFTEAERNTITNYDTLFDAMVSKLSNSVSGITVEKISFSETNQVQLKIRSNNTSDYITINSSGLDSSGNKISASNALMNSLGIVAYKEKAAATLMSASVFSPSIDTSKITFAAKNSGYANRLIITSDDAFTQIGLTQEILTNRYKNSDNGITTNDSKAGFTYGTRWIEADGTTISGSPESSSNNFLNSKFTFNGLTIQRESNTISDLSLGLTINLKSVMKETDDDVTVAITNSTSNVRSKIDSFISKFNDLYTYIKSRTYSTKGSRGVFTGDSAALGLLSTLSSNATSAVNGISSNSLNILNKLGISFNATSGLSVTNSELLEDRLSQKLSEVETLFNSSQGIASRFYSSLSTLEGTDGSVSKMISSYNSNITSINDKITATNSRIDKSAVVLRSKYEKLQLQLATLLNMQSLYSGSTSSSE